MALLSGTVDSGWEKSVTRNGSISYHCQITHIAGTSSNQVTGALPTEVINHLFKQFSNLHIAVNWGSGTKTTTFNLLVLGFHYFTDILQTKEIFASAGRNNDEKAVMIIPKNLYSSDGAFVETTNVISPNMAFQDLASSGDGTNTVDITIAYSPDESDLSLKAMGDVFSGY